MYAYLLKNAQRAKTLSIGGVAPLNMGSCLNVSVFDISNYLSYFIQITFHSMNYRSSRGFTRV